ncbi:ribokinase, partial [Pseudomonas syringae pv. actinidiae ICMP 18804]
MTVVEGVSTGIASIVVDANSQNAIVIVAGGNGRLTPALIERFDALLAGVILNPAPASEPLPANWYGLIDYLIPNESEAHTLTGVTVDSS